MKKVFLLIFFFPFLAFSQEPQKNNNTIIVKGVSFNKVKETLLDAGIFIDQQNADDGTIITKRKGYCECPNKEFFQLIYYIRIKDSIASIKGRFNIIVTQSDNDENNFIEVKYWKAKNTGMHYVFGIMDKFAKSLNGTMLEYKTL